MSLLANSNAIESGGYQINNSLRFRSSASAYLNRTPASAGNRNVWTWSGWVKATNDNADNYIFGAASSSNDRSLLVFNNGTLIYAEIASGSVVCNKVTSAVYRDYSAWYHIVFVYDCGNAVAEDRNRLYVNGQRVTSFSTSTNTPLNQSSQISNNVLHTICRRTESAANYNDCYLAEVNFIDGQALTPSSFGQTDPVTGVWVAVKYTGTYGTNGFYLPFSNGSSTTTLGYDQSGNGNNWTTNNISLTSGSTYDWMVDSPTLGAVASNTATLSPNIPNTGTISGGNLNFNGSSTWGGCTSGFGLASGKWYFEATVTGINDDMYVGIIKTTVPAATSPATTGAIYYCSAFAAGSGQLIVDGTTITTTAGAAYKTVGDVVGVSIDVDVGEIKFYKNNSLIFTRSTGISGITWLPQFDIYGTSGALAINFGQRPFAYTPPTGFVALNTFNLPDPTIKAGNKYMDVSTWTGDNATPKAVVSNLAFQPDFLWLKQRSAVNYHFLQNSITGAANYLASNATDAESSGSSGGWIQSFNSNGYTTVTGSSNSNNVNGSGITYVGWSWKAGGTAVSNTAGSITSQVSANTTAGFSVVTYTGNGTGGATVGHGLGVAPKMVISKRRDFADDWSCYHASLGGTKYIDLNSTAAAGTSIVVWNNTNPSSSVVTLGTSNRVNGSSGTYVAYCFAEIAGYSKFGSYTGNGSADGPFVYCGFRPKFVLIKASSTTSNWQVIDTSRSTYNEIANKMLYPNTSDAEGGSGYNFDIVSNGFKLRNLGSDYNTNGATYIYAAFAENPFKYSNAR